MRILLLITLIWYQLANLSMALATGVFWDAEVNPTKVLTATRLQQSPTEVPGSLTVLDRELIKASSARTIPEMLRLVPGMQVITQNGHTPSVNYHGGDPEHSRRMQILIDGQSVLTAAITTVHWNDLPIAIDDIERIEIFRSPNTVSYGANSLFGVINIITRPTQYTHNSRIKVNQGADGINDWYLNTGHSWNTGGSWLSIARKSDNGFTQNTNKPLQRSFNSGNEHTNIRWQGSQNLAHQQKISWFLAGSKGTNYAPSNTASSFFYDIFGEFPQWKRELPNMDANANLKNTSYNAGAHWSWDLSEQHLIEAKVGLSYFQSKQNWNSCELALLYIDYDQWPLDPAGNVIIHPENYVCGNIQQNLTEKRFDIELQDTFNITPELRTIQGIRFRKDFAYSDDYFNHSANRYISSLFWQGEWQATNHWLLQSGLMFEHDSIVGESYTPRLAANYLFSPAHSLRLVYSEATRSPDLFDLKGNRQYRMRFSHISGFTPPSSNKYIFNFTGNPKLDQERMRSIELGYHGIFEEPSLTLDIKLFHDKINNIISRAPNIQTFETINNYSLKLYGFEMEADWQINADNRFRSTYTQLEDKGDYKRHHHAMVATHKSSKHTASLAWLKQWPSDWHTSLMYFYYSGNKTLSQNRQLQARISKSMFLKEKDITIAFNWRHVFDQPDTHQLAGTPYSMRYKSNSQFYFSVEAEF
ncbi:TonB-dependent receptor [Pseudomonas sp. F1_0610]|uniref:TonB-dependent receptor plug domain-containing protein n=1 Tax=Pseudomonas sp. F1_0610 TaxID=3114284 RepID=UPI0039C26F8A